MNYDLFMLMTGRNGARIVNDTAAYTGDWRRVGILADAVIATITLDNATSTNVSASAGADIYGNISAITLTSGTVVLYK